MISVDVNDGLENQMDPDTWDFEGCGFSALVDLRRETSILLSQSFSALGAVLERTADGAQERLLLYIAADLIGGLAQFIEGSYEISSCIMGCNSRTGGDGIQEPYEQLYQRLEKKVLAFCKLIDASAKVSDSTVHLRQHPPSLPSKRAMLKAAEETLKDGTTGSNHICKKLFEGF